MKLAPLNAPRTRMLNQHSIWLSQLASGGEVEVDSGMARQPVVVFGFVGVQVVQNDVYLLIGMEPDNLVHEVQELYPPAAFGVLGDSHFAGQHVKGGEQSGGTMARIFMTEAGYRAAVGQFEVALRPLQHLDMGLFVHRQD